MSRYPGNSEWAVNHRLIIPSELECMNRKPTATIGTTRNEFDPSSILPYVAGCTVSETLESDAKASDRLVGPLRGNET